MTPLGIAANLMIATSIILAGRNSIHTWWTGIIGCGLFAAVFFRHQLYADTVLQLFFIGICIAGWRQWRFGNHGHALPVTNVRPHHLMWWLLAGTLGALGYGLLLHQFTDAYAPFLDSIVLAFSIVAQLLMMRRYVQSWPFWLLVDSIAVPLYANRGLYLTSILYSVYLVNALVAWYHWRRLSKAEAPIAVA